MSPRAQARAPPPPLPAIPGKRGRGRASFVPTVSAYQLRLAKGLEYLLKFSKIGVTSSHSSVG